MIEHKSEENNETENKNLTEYELIWKKIRELLDFKASEQVPLMYDALIKEGYTPQEARDKIKKDSINIWKKETIDKYIPEEAKQQIQVLAGKEKGKTKQEIEDIYKDSPRLQSSTKVISNDSNIGLTDQEIQQIAKKDYVSKSDISRQEEEKELQNAYESAAESTLKEYNVTIFFAGKDIQLKVIATNLKKIIPPNKYVSVVIN